jgi:hypothetical protein
VFWYFSSLLLIISIRKLLASIDNASANGWRLYHLGGTCYTTQWSNLTFYRLLGCTIGSSSTRDDACRLMVVEFSPTIVCFFPLLFSLLTDKVNIYPLCFLFFNFSPHSFNFLFHSYSIYSFSSHSLNFLFHFYSF